jgi:D-proline reductase (dithiol) PrdB
MRVDSYRFLPRSFRPMFEGVSPLDGETEPVWSPFEPRLSEATVMLVTSAGLYRRGEQPSFDGDRERREPTWGDPSWRLIPRATEQGELAMMHLHVNPDDVLADHEVALPLRALDRLVADGIVGASAPTHVSVMGYQAAGLRAWRERTAPAIVDVARGDGVDGVVLAPV